MCEIWDETRRNAQTPRSGGREVEAKPFLWKSKIKNHNNSFVFGEIEMTFQLILTREVSKGSFILDGFEPDKPGNL